MPKTTNATGVSAESESSAIRAESSERMRHSSKAEPEPSEETRQSSTVQPDSSLRSGQSSAIQLGSSEGTSHSSTGAGERKKQTTKSEKKTERKRRRRRKRVRIGDALRCEGLDERDVAQKLKQVIERQTQKSGKDGNSDKLVAEVLMNCFRYLDDGPRPAAPGDLRVPMKMVHSIPRPRRIENEKKGRVQ